jgi:hypothetical protein
VRESSKSAPLVPAVFETSLCHPRQAAGERRGEGEPELDRRSAPSHLRDIMRSRIECAGRSVRAIEWWIRRRCRR